MTHALVFPADIYLIVPVSSQPVATKRRSWHCNYLGMALCHDLGKFFFMQGRPDFYSDGCVTYCLVEYQHCFSDFRFVEEFIRKNNWLHYSTRRSVHAEEMVLREIVMTELTENW